MPGFMPGIHAFESSQVKDVDGRDKPGHDEYWGANPSPPADRVTTKPSNTAPVRAGRRTGDNCGDKAAGALRERRSAPVIAAVENFETKTGVRRV
jgi:hypothetical protein